MHGSEMLVESKATSQLQKAYLGSPINRNGREGARIRFAEAPMRTRPGANVACATAATAGMAGGLSCATRMPRTRIGASWRSTRVLSPAHLREGAGAVCGTF